MLVTISIGNNRHLPATVSGFCVAVTLYCATLAPVALGFCIAPTIKDNAHILLTLQQA